MEIEKGHYSIGLSLPWNSAQLAKVAQSTSPYSLRPKTIGPRSPSACGGSPGDSSRPAAGGQGRRSRFGVKDGGRLTNGDGVVVVNSASGRNSSAVQTTGHRWDSMGRSRSVGLCGVPRGGDGAGGGRAVASDIEHLVEKEAARGELTSGLLVGGSSS
jgi:hypothetical protein